MLKRGIARAITLFASLFIFASSLGVASPAKASTYDGVSGTIDCSISGTVTIANNVVTTHSNCSGSVEIPAGVTSVGNTAFDNAVELTGINVHLNNPIFSSSSGVLFNKAATALIRYPSGQSAISYTIPKTCKPISKQTKSTLPVVSTYKGKYLAAKVTGLSAGTSPTSYLTVSSAKVT